MLGWMRVRVHRQAVGQWIALDHSSCVSRRERAAPTVQEDDVGRAGSYGQDGSTAVQPRVEGGTRRLTDRDAAHLGALSENGDEAPAEIAVGDPQPAAFGDPEAGAVQDLE